MHYGHKTVCPSYQPQYMLFSSLRKCVCKSDSDIYFLLGRMHHSFVKYNLCKLFQVISSELLIRLAFSM